MFLKYSMEFFSSENATLIFYRTIAICNNAYAFPVNDNGL